MTSHGMPAAAEGALQLKAARAGFVATLHRPAGGARRLTKRRIVGLSDDSVMQRRRPVTREQHRRDRRRRMLIERNQRSRLHGDRPPLYAALL